ncbi:MAG: hypothetical protein M1576_03195 [Deltaproteobacteria bacterium]|nr:hypothetical protein [Deltaproteobacteria bacterium]
MRNEEVKYENCMNCGNAIYFDGVWKHIKTENAYCYSDAKAEVNNQLCEHTLRLYYFGAVDIKRISLRCRNLSGHIGSHSFGYESGDDMYFMYTEE